jgi:hypothetical protein
MKLRCNRHVTGIAAESDIPRDGRTVSLLDPDVRWFIGP